MRLRFLLSHVVPALGALCAFTTSCLWFGVGNGARGRFWAMATVIWLLVFYVRNRGRR